MWTGDGSPRSEAAARGSPGFACWVSGAKRVLYLNAVVVVVVVVEPPHHRMQSCSDRRLLEEQKAAAFCFSGHKCPYV